MKLVLLHALPLDSRMWEATVGARPETSIAPDLFALGPTIQDWAAGVLEKVGTEEIVVVGCSVGASCALEVARAAPDRVAGIVIVGGKAAVNPEPDLRDEALSVLETEGLAAAWDRYWAPLFADTTPESIVSSARTLALAQDVTHIANGVRAFHDRRDLTGFAAGWPGPLIGISGDRDVSPTPARVRTLATGPNRRFHLVRDCGHYVNLEQPARFDAILADSLRWIASASSKSR